MTRHTRVACMTLIVATATVALLGGVVVYTGVYDASATAQHTAAVYRFLEVSLRRSVKLRTADIQVPNLEDSDRIVSGFTIFRAHCVQCHGAPGIAPEPFALGLTPVPASLVASAKAWSAADTYWLIRHGIKMSGMPAWQYRLSDEKIWDIVAFMKVLPTLSPADYESWNTRHRITPAVVPETLTANPGQTARLGDVRAGRNAMQQYLCISCHVIPGVVGAKHHVGPTLAGMGSRKYIAGVLPNTPANMVRWLRDPRGVDPLTAMPALGVSDKDARDMAAFLHTLKSE